MPQSQWVPWPFNIIFQRLDQILVNQGQIMGQLNVQASKLEKIMASIDDVVADVNAASDLITSVSTAIGGLQQMLKDALSGLQVPPAVQAKIDSVFATAEANKAALAAALTSAAPPTTPPPAPPAAA